MTISIPSITVGAAIISASTRIAGHVATVAANQARGYVDVARHLPAPEVETRLLALRMHPPEVKAVIAAVRAVARDVEAAALILEGKEAEGGELAEAAARIGRGVGEERTRVINRLHEVAAMIEADIAKATKRLGTLDGLHSHAAVAALATGKIDASKIVGKFRLPPSVVHAGAGPTLVQVRARAFIRQLREG